MRKNAVRFGIFMFVWAKKSGESQLTLISATKKMPKLDVLVERLRAAAPSLTGILLNHNQRDDNVILGNRTDGSLGGSRCWRIACAGTRFLLSPEAFYQVNPCPGRASVRVCGGIVCGVDGRGNRAGPVLWRGTITLTLAERAKTVIGVEIVPEAVENAKRNAARNGMENVEFLCADAGRRRGSLPDAASMCWLSTRLERAWTK